MINIFIWFHNVIFHIWKNFSAFPLTIFDWDEYE